MGPSCTSLAFVLRSFFCLFLSPFLCARDVASSLTVSSVTSSASSALNVFFTLVTGVIENTPARFLVLVAGTIEYVPARWKNAFTMELLSVVANGFAPN